MSKGKTMGWKHLFLFLTHLLFTTGVLDVEDESKFPAELPNEPWGYEVVWFQLEPQDSFVLRSRPATLVCRAASALKVYFKCNGQVVPNSKQIFQEFHHENTGAPITEVQFNVSRKDVEDFHGSEPYRCECVAWNKRGNEKTPAVRVELAFLKKYFEQSPYAKSVEMDTETELRCIAPDGIPTPAISWLRDGRVIENGYTGNSNHIITTDGHFLIAQTKLSDMGNYSCVAENIASRRVSEPALLTVYVNGGWSQWSAWGECQGQCGKGVQKRTRLCNSPAPLNGGRPCSGPSFQKQDCFLPCPPVDGRWSSWSSWSICGADCKQQKRRSCTNPSPANGGKLCPAGKDLMVINCTGGLCKDPESEGSLPQPELDLAGEIIPVVETSDHVTQTVTETDVALHIGLGVAIAAVIIMGFVMVKVMRRKGRNHIMYDMAPSDYPPGYFPDPSKKLGMQPDLTVVSESRDGGSSATSQTTNVVGNPLCYEYTYPTSGIRSDNPPKTPDISEHHYDVPHLHLQKQSAYIRTAGGLGGSPSSEDNCKQGFRLQQQSNKPEKGFFVSTSLDRRSSSSESTSTSFSSSDDSSSNSSTRENRVARREPDGLTNLFRDSMTSTTFLLDGLDPENLTWGAADASGCRLTLKDSAVTLTIPEGALQTPEELYCAVLSEEKDRPALTDGQTLLSPVISCGPSSVNLLKPAILCFQHAAALKYGGWKMSLYHFPSTSTLDSKENSPKWKTLAKVGEETIDTPVFIQLDLNQVLLVTDRLERFALVGESEPGKQAVKTLRLAVFGPAHPQQFSSPKTVTEYNIRIYVMDDTVAALERVFNLEKKLGGRVLDRPRSLLFQDVSQNLCVSLEDVGSGWRCKSQSGYQEILFSEIWSSRQQHLVTTVTLEKTERCASPICFRLLAFQYGVQLQRQTFRIRTDLNPVMKSRTNGAATGILRNSSPEVTLVPKSCTVTMSSGCGSMATLEATSPQFRLPQSLKKKLCQLLDPAHPGGKDWKLLAQKLGFDRFTNFLTLKSSPTEYILDLWDVKSKKPEGVTDLLNALRLMERQDAVGIFEKEMGPWI